MWSLLCLNVSSIFSSIISPSSLLLEVRVDAVSLALISSGSVVDTSEFTESQRRYWTDVRITKVTVTFLHFRELITMRPCLEISALSPHAYIQLVWSPPAKYWADLHRYWALPLKITGFPFTTFQGKLMRHSQIVHLHSKMVLQGKWTPWSSLRYIVEILSLPPTSPPCDEDEELRLVTFSITQPKLF